jgi:putative oxidoreductase
MSIAAKSTARSEPRAIAISTTDVALLVLRLGLGVIFFAHGAQKVLGMFGGPGLEGTVGFMGKIGIPAALAYVAAFTEFLGGIALIFGVLSRVAALGLFITMLVAMFKVHLANGFFLSPDGKSGIEYTVALSAMALAILIAGPGRVAVSDWDGKLLGLRSR